MPKFSLREATRTAESLPPADEGVRVPQAIRQAAERAEAIHAEVYKPDTPEGNEPVPQPDTTTVTDPAPAAPQVPDATTTDPAPVSPAPATPAGETIEDEGSYEHKYKSLKGRYDRATTQISQLTGRIADLERLAATLQTATAPAPTPAAPTRLLTEQEEKDYGTEFLSVVGKKAREELLPVVDQRIAELERKVNSVAQVTAVDHRQQMLQQLEASLPNWRDVNTDPNFIAWLRLPDPYSGVTRQSLLMQAYESNQASRVLAFFNGFLSDEAAVSPQPAQQPANVTPGDPTPSNKVPLEVFAAPGRAKTAAASPPAPAEKPVITRQFIASFYADVSAGKYRGRDDDKNRIERSIFEAQAEGRIQ